MISPENWKEQCTACGKEVTYASGFKCAAKPGNHRLQNVTFYHTGGRDLQHPFDRRNWSPTLIYPRADVFNERTGKSIPQPPLEIHFQQTGKLDSDDAEVIFNLQTNSQAVGWGRDGRQTWEKIYLTPESRKNLAEQELARVNAQLQEQNALLEQTKRQKAAVR